MLLNYIKRFWEVQKIEKILLFKGVIIAMFFYILISVFPLRTYIKLLKYNPNQSSGNSDITNIKECNKLVQKSINRIEKLVPWEFSCLYKVITAKYLYCYLGIPSEIVLELFNITIKGSFAHASLMVNSNFHYLKIKEERRQIKF